MRDLSSCRTMPLTSLEVKGLGVATAADLPVAAGLPASSAPAAAADGDRAGAAFWSSAWPFLAFAGGLGFRGRRHAAVSWPPAPQLKQRPSVGSNRAPSDLQWRIGHGQPALQPVARLLKCGQMATPLPPASSLPFPSLPFGSPLAALPPFGSPLVGLPSLAAAAAAAAAARAAFVEGLGGSFSVTSPEYS